MMGSELHHCPHCGRSIRVKIGVQGNPILLEKPEKPRPEYPQSEHMLLERDLSGNY